ncbi:hypothetical protein [Pseudochrobactrum sp. B5]|uniref:hypothetical protein n=1 Tax=Pseudochrobactrum sp. B5 TaxID=1289478 RepID=UPI000952946D|nr:hypothetical protein [Pseudochrobactrum sp. B5]
MNKSTQRNVIDKADISIINNALSEICAASFIELKSEEGQAIANSVVREYMAGHHDPKELVDLMLRRINMADKLKRKRERILEH